MDVHLINNTELKVNSVLIFPFVQSFLPWENNVNILYPFIYFSMLIYQGGVFICFLCVFFSQNEIFFPTTYSSTSLSDIFHLPLIFLLNSFKATNFQMLEFKLFKGDFGKFKEKENEQKNRCGKEWDVFVEFRVRHIFLEERNCSREFWDT